MSLIRILATSDVHGTVFPEYYGDRSWRRLGIAALKKAFDELRDENTLIIDNGDTLEGTPLTFRHYSFEPDQVCPITKAMKAAGYDLINLGNHDFNYGEQAMFTHMENSGAACITANVFYKGERICPPYRIIEKGGKKLAVFGVITQYIPFWEKAEHIRNFTFADAFETAKEITRMIRENEQADYVVCCYHGGFERDIETGEPNQDLTGENEGYMMLKEIEGIDILISGHQHRTLCGQAFGKVYTQTASTGSEFACIEIDETGIHAEIRKPAEEADQQVLDLVQEEEDACQIWLDQALGRCISDLKVTDEFDARLHKTQLITFLNKVQAEATGAQLSASALFSGATGFDSEITMRNIVSTYVFPNTLTLKKMSGKQLRAYLEKCAEYWDVRDGQIIVSPAFDYPTPMHFNYDMIDGAEYTIKASNPVGQRIVSLKVDGKDVTDDDFFTICVNNYRAGGSGGFSMVREAETLKEDLTAMVDILAAYIMDKKTIEFEPVHNIQVIV